MPDNEEQKPRSARKLLILIGVLPVLLWIGREFVLGRTIWYFRAADLADMAILGPILMGVLLYLWFYMFRYGAPTRLLVVFAVLMIGFMWSHAMHATANSINTFATEVRDYRDVIPDDLYQLIFFLDERLSHWLLFGFTTGLLGCWLIFDQSELAPPIFPRNLILLFILGVIYGIVKAYGLIEARVIFMIIPSSIVLLGLWFWYWRRGGLSLSDYLRHRPFTTFVAIFSIFTVLTMIVWGIVFNGFPQPSEIFF